MSNHHVPLLTPFPHTRLSGPGNKDEVQWNGLTDYKGRKWGFKSNGLCKGMAYLNNFQSNYNYYDLTRTAWESNKHECGGACKERKCPTCVDYEAVFSDGGSGQCGGYQGLSSCDFRVACRNVDGNTRICDSTGSSCRS